MSADIKPVVQQAMCRNCGQRIERQTAGWWHTSTGESRCALNARPVSAWGGRP